MGDVEGTWAEGSPWSSVGGREPPAAELQWVLCRRQFAVEENLHVRPDLVGLSPGEGVENSFTPGRQEVLSAGSTGTRSTFDISLNAFLKLLLSTQSSGVSRNKGRGSQRVTSLCGVRPTCRTLTQVLSAFRRTSVCV